MIDTKTFGRWSVSVFFPAYNDAGTIGMMVDKARHVLRGLTDDYEIIVVNDASSDRTREIIEGLADEAGDIKIVHHEVNQGYGGALRSGFAHATKELVFYTDGDAQYDSAELTALWDLMDDDTDVVNGYKLKRMDSTCRIVLGTIYNKLARFFFRIPICDVDCDFRLIRRSALDAIALESSSGVICVELIRKLHDEGCRFRQIPVHHYARTYGTSQFFTPRRVLKTALDFFRLWFRLVVLGSGKRELRTRISAAG